MANKDDRRNHTGAFVRLPHTLLTTQAYRGLSPNARALLVDLVMMEKGKNNGALYLSVRDAANRLGLADLKSASGAIDELEANGFIAMTADAHFSSRATDGSRARSWRLTWLPAGAAPTHEYHHAKLTDVRARKRADRGGRALKAYMKQNGGQETSTRWPESVEESRTLPVKQAGTDPAVVRETSTLIRETPLVPVDRPCSGNLHTYSLPSTAADLGSLKQAETAAGADGTSVDPWLLDDLRSMIRDHLDDAGPGAQSRLANGAHVPGGTLSRFLGGKGLPRTHFISLQLELARQHRVASMEARHAA